MGPTAIYSARFALPCSYGTPTIQLLIQLCPMASLGHAQLSSAFFFSVPDSIFKKSLILPSVCSICP